MWHALGMFLGRVCLSAIFILAGIGKFMDYNGTAAYMAAKGMTMIPFFLIAAAIVEIVGGLSLLLGYKAKWGATLLMLFLIPVTLIFHDFWAVADKTEAKFQMINFMKNLAIFGGLWFLACCGAGRWSCDTLFYKKT